MNTGDAIIVIKRIKPEEFRRNAMDLFNRHQIVHHVYRWTDNRLLLIPQDFEEDWSLERKREKAAEIQSGRFFVFGAFIEDQIVGQIMLLPELHAGRMIVDSFHVSKEHRRQGIGKELFTKAKGEARLHGAKALYISASPAQETIDFYRSVGCEVSRNPIGAYVMDEPFDIQMECTL